MAKSTSFHCSVITPERAVLECDATFVAFPAHDGEMGVLRHRAPLVCRMGIGPLRIETTGEKHLLFVDGGFAQVVDDRLTILTEQAKRAQEIDDAAASRAMVEARSIRITDDVSFQKRSRGIRRAQVQLRLAKSKS